MSGLKNLFLKLTPIMLLICCICYGILHTFSSNGESNITYLQTQYINTETYEPYVNPTEEQKEQALKVYNFDMVSYTQNIDQDILKRSVANTLTLQAYQQTLENFDEIWQDGYNIFDVSKTIANGVVLVINTLILPLNILLIPLRITAGILLTGMSLIGININNGAVIIPLLTFILDRLTIPFITPQNINVSPIAQESWQFKQNINELWIGNQEIAVDFKIDANQSNIYDKIRIQQYNGSHVKLQYHVKNTVADSWETVFDSGRTGNPWFNEYQIRSNIIIQNNEGMSQQQAEQVTAFLQHYANYIQVA